MQRVSIILSDIKTPKQAIYKIDSLISLQLKSKTEYTDKELVECIQEIAVYALQKEQQNKK